MRYRLAVGLLCVLIAGCDGSGSSSQRSQLPESVPAAGKGSQLIFSSSATNNTIDYYVKGTGPNNPVAGSLSGSFSNPEGIAIDSHGNIYVANNNAENVLVYAAGSTSPTGTLDDPGEFPVGVTVGPDGTVYVANLDGPVGASGDVVFTRRAPANQPRRSSTSVFCASSVWRSTGTATCSPLARSHRVTATVKW